MFLNVYVIIDNLCSILEIITRPSEIRNKKRKRKGNYNLKKKRKEKKLKRKRKKS